MREPTCCLPFSSVDLPKPWMIAIITMIFKLPELVLMTKPNQTLTPYTATRVQRIKSSLQNYIQETKQLKPPKATRDLNDLSMQGLSMPQMESPPETKESRKSEGNWFLMNSDHPNNVKISQNEEMGDDDTTPPGDLLPSGALFIVPGRFSNSEKS